MNRFFPVFKREYFASVKNKWFWITTLLGPVGFALLILIPAFISQFDQEPQVNLLLIQTEEFITEEVRETTPDTIILTFEDISTDEARDTLRENGEYDAFIDFGQINPAEGDYSVTVVSRRTLSLSQEGLVSQFLTPNLQQLRLKREDISAEQAQRILQPIRPTFTSLDADTPSSGQAFALAYGAGFLMYFFLLAYGMSVMKSVQEEKKNRIVEILLSSMNATDLLFGKIFGVLAVGATQIFLWFGLSLLTIPLLAGVRSQGASDVDTLDFVWQESQSVFQTLNIFFILPVFLAFLFLGLLMYAGIYACIAASADSESDIQTLSNFATIPIIIGFISSFVIINNPNTPLATVLSIIPFISPLTMMARIPFDVPAWQITLSLGLLLLTAMGTIWLSAKIYRIGILLYGERLSWKHLKALFR